MQLSDISEAKSVSGAVAVPSLGMGPGWIAGAASGATGAAFTYGLTCWW